MNIPEPAPLAEAGFDSGGVPRWSTPQCAFAIDYSPSLMGGLRRQSVTGMHALSRGGLEVGGLLFGRVFPNARTPKRIELVAERSIECAHESGPAFLLSGQELLQIETQIEQARRDSELAGLSVLGFWVSHSRGELELSAGDLELYKLFPHPWQVALILKPKNGATTQANFGFRRGGQVHQPDPRAVLSADHPGGSVGHPVQPVPRTTPAGKNDSSRAIPLALAIALTLFAFLAGAALITWVPLPASFSRSGSPDIPLVVQFFNAGPGTAVHWSANARELQGASRAELVVVDSAKTYTYPLSAVDMRRGYFYCDSVHDARMAAIRLGQHRDRLEWPVRAAAAPMIRD